MKKLVVLLLALCCMVFAACGTEDVPEPVVSEDPVEETLLGSEPVTIRFWHSASDEAGVLMDSYIKEFNEINAYGITVEPVYQGQYADATTLLKTVLSAENYEELPDVMQTDATGKIPYHTSGRAFSVDDCITAFDLDASVTDPFLAGALANWQFQGVQLGVPFATSTTVTYYNADLLAAAGWDRCPETLAEVGELYVDMQAAGLSEQAIQCLPNTPTLANWLGQLGSDLVDQHNGSEGTASTVAECVENGTLAEFLTEWKALYETGALINENTASERFVAGEVALMISSSSSISSVLEKVNGSFEVGVAPYLRVNENAAPGATVSGSCLVMFDSGDQLKKEAAWAFVQYLTSGGIQADFAMGTGYVPSTAAAQEDAAFAELIAEHPQYQVALDQIAAMPDNMVSVTVGPAADFYYMIMQCVSDMLEYDLSVDETVTVMQEELDALLANYLRNNS